MLVRATLVAVTAAALLPFVAGTAHASCLDDARTGLEEGYTASPKSPYWSTNYVQVTGTATVTVQGDALVSDWSSYAVDWARYFQTYADNAPEVTTEFVDCVAG